MKQNRLILISAMLLFSVISAGTAYSADPFRSPSPEQALFFAHPGCMYDNPQEILSLKVTSKNKIEEVKDLGKLPYHGTDGSGNWSKRISCIRVGKNIHKVEAYSKPNFKGDKHEYGPGNHDISGSWEDDRISSLKIIMVKDKEKPAEKKEPAKKKTTKKKK